MLSCTVTQLTAARADRVNLPAADDDYSLERSGRNLDAKETPKETRRDCQTEDRSVGPKQQAYLSSCAPPPNSAHSLSLSLTFPFPFRLPVYREGTLLAASREPLRRAAARTRDRKLESGNGEAWPNPQLWPLGRPAGSVV